MKFKLPPAATILVAMVIGIVVGYMIFVQFPDKKTAAQIAGYISIMSDVFLRLIKMLIAPLVFSTLVVGIAHMGDAASVGRVFAKALGWFITASLVSLVLGLVLANLLQPGHNLGLPLPDIGTSANLATSKFTLKDFVSHLVPRSFAEAMANNEILQIVVFSMFFGVALAALGDKAKTLVARHRRAVARHAEDHRLRDEAGADRGAGGDGGDRRRQRPGDPGQVRRLHGRLLSGPRHSLVAPDLCRLRLPRAAHRAAAGPHQGGLHGLVRDRELRGGVPEDPRRARPLRRQAQDLQLRDAHGLFVQPRRLDDVLHVRDALHRAGLRHRAARSAPSSRCC